MIINRHSRHSLGGSRWYLHENLYLPVSKLVHENAAIIDAIFLHAEHLGNVAHGYMLKVAREIKSEISEQMASMDHSISSLSSHVDIVESRVNDN